MTFDSNLPSLIHYSQCRYLKSWTCILDLLIFLEVYQNPRLFSLALPLSLLYNYISSWFRYLVASFESSAYPSLIVFYLIFSLSLTLKISPKIFISYLYFSDPATLSSINSPSIRCLKYDWDRSHISLGWMFPILTNFNYEK